MKATVFTIDGKEKGETALPDVFRAPVRADIIKRAVLSMQSRGRQPHGTDPMAGKRKSGYRSKRRKIYRSTYGPGRSRSPGKIMSVRGMRIHYIGAFAPNTAGGRATFPPQTEKVIEEKINRKERIMAIRGGIAATADREMVRSRHRLGEVRVPLIIENKVESMKKTSDVQKMLESLGLKDEVVRASQKKVRPGRGKMRGRPYRRRKGPLFVVSKRCDLLKAAKNIPGADVSVVKDLNAELLAPGCQPGRLCVWSEDAIKGLEVLFK